MYPEIVRFGDFSISSFGLMIAVCFIVGYWLIMSEARRKKLDEKMISNMFLLTMIGGIVGAKVLYIFENVPLEDIMSNPMTYLLQRGGLTFYGGFIGALILVWITARMNKISMWVIGDMASPALAISYSIGRVGCLLVGDDYGVPSNLPWAMAFPKGLPPTDIPVHPTQLYEVIIMFIAFLFIWRIRTLPRVAGWLFSIYLIIAGFERFFIEFIRSTTPSPIPGLSVAQVTAIGLIIVGAVKLWSIYSKGAVLETPPGGKKRPSKKKA